VKKVASVLIVFIFAISIDLLSQDNQSVSLCLKTVTGRLRIEENVTPRDYQVYFHIPIPYHHQGPICIEVEGPHLVDYRFLSTGGPNRIVAACLHPAWETHIEWKATVLMRQNRYSDLPADIPVPDADQLPDSVKKWLLPTDCVQADADIVRLKADSLRAVTDDLMQLADAICDAGYRIPWRFSRQPVSFDAVYALKWGSSCVGRTHACAALFRANGIPARVLLNLPSGSRAFDMHWNLEYYVPDYGWVRMEPTSGTNPWPAENDVVTMACNPQDEFPVFQSDGAEVCYHTSDPSLGYNPLWAQAHNVYDGPTISTTVDSADRAFAFTDSVFVCFSRIQGLPLLPTQEAAFQTAHAFHESAYEKIKDGDLPGYLSDIDQAWHHYRQIQIEPISTVFFDDFEEQPRGWMRGGTQDEWEWGSPTWGPSQAYSGNACWGTDLDHDYENRADCWLASPAIDLTHLCSAYLSFWVWNSVEEDLGVLVYDPLWLDISTNGTDYEPLCSRMAGVNDDPEIPQTGGWSNVVLDLTRFVGGGAHIRFRFQSDENRVFPGSYIDDVHVYGRYQSQHPYAPPDGIVLSQNHPNPFNTSTRITYTLPEEAHVILDVFNALGQNAVHLIHQRQPAGIHSVVWHPDNLGSGVYIYRIKANAVVKTKKCVLLR